MHDSRAGGFGVIGAALLLLVKFVSLNSVPPNVMLFTLVAASVISRWAMVYSVFAYPYARPSGLGKSFKEVTGWKQFTKATLVALAITMVLFKFAGLAILFSAWLLVILIASYLKRKFAG